MTNKAKKKDVPSVAVVGSGYWGKNLIRNFYNLGALKLICEKNNTLLDTFREQYPGIETCLAFNDVIRDDEIEIPSGESIIKPNDRIIIFAKRQVISKIEKILTVKLEFF